MIHILLDGHVACNVVTWLIAAAGSAAYMCADMMGILSIQLLQCAAKVESQSLLVYATAGERNCVVVVALNIGASAFAAETGSVNGV